MSSELSSRAREMRRRVSRAGWIVALAVWGGGCQSPPRALFPTAERAIERLREQAECSRAVQGEAALSFSGDGRRLNGRVLYLAAAPSRLRFDVFSSFGVTLSTLTSDGARFGLYNLEEKSFIYGPASTCNVQRFTQVPAPPFALVELLRGQAPVLKHEPGQAQIRYVSPLLGRGYYEIEVQGEHESFERIRLGVHPDDIDAPLEAQRLRLLRVEVSQEGEGLYEVDLEGHARVQNASIVQSAEEKALGIEPPAPSGPACSAELPRTVRFFVPASGNELIFQSEELWHNPPLYPAAFQQEFPGGVILQESQCGDALENQVKLTISQK